MVILSKNCYCTLHRNILSPRWLITVHVIFVHSHGFQLKRKTPWLFVKDDDRQPLVTILIGHRQWSWWNPHFPYSNDYTQRLKINYYRYIYIICTCFKYNFCKLYSELWSAPSYAAWSKRVKSSQKHFSHNHIMWRDRKRLRMRLCIP